MKDWLIKLGIDQAGPSAIRGAILGAFGWLIAHGTILSHYGVISDQAAGTTTIHWHQLGPALIAGLPAAAALVIKLFQVHGTNAVKAVTSKGETPQ